MILLKPEILSHKIILLISSHIISSHNSLTKFYISCIFKIKDRHSKPTKKPDFILLFQRHIYILRTGPFANMPENIALILQKQKTYQRNPG